MLLEGALALHDAMQSQQQEEATEQANENEIVGQDVDEINSSPPITVNSSSSESNDEDVEIGQSWMRQRSRSRDSTPDRGYPKKKY